MRLKAGLREQELSGDTAAGHSQGAGTGLVLVGARVRNELAKVVFTPAPFPPLKEKKEEAGSFGANSWRGNG